MTFETFFELISSQVCIQLISYQDYNYLKSKLFSSRAVPIAILRSNVVRGQLNQFTELKRKKSGGLVFNMVQVFVSFLHASFARHHRVNKFDRRLFYESSVCKFEYLNEFEFHMSKNKFIPQKFHGTSRFMVYHVDSLSVSII